MDRRLAWVFKKASLVRFHEHVWADEDRLDHATASVRDRSCWSVARDGRLIFFALNCWFAA